MTADSQQNQALLLIGTYTDTCQSNGIYIYEFDLETADFAEVTSTENVISPSFLTISDDKKFIYSVNEDGENSTVSAFSWNASGREVNFLNSQPSGGASSCFIINDSENVIVANYEGGTIGVFGKSADGSLTSIRQVVAHRGSGPNAERQEKAHVHMVAFSPDGKYLLANDLGTDEICLYDYNANEPETVLTLKSKVKVKPASGPRHLTFSPDGKHAYVIHELDGTLTAFSYAEGQLEKIQETTVVQHGFEGEIAAADIQISADGRFLYATNRGDANTASVFSVEPSGKLAHVETIATKGKGPRSLGISPNGKFVVIAHEESNEIVIFSRDSQSGRLSATQKKISLCAPVCVKFMTP